MANERHIDARGWEIDFSTRQSGHPYTKYQPFRQALSTTADTLLTTGRGEIAVNWVTNPRIEATDISMFVAAAGTTGAVVERSTAQKAVGAASLLVNPENAAAGEGFYWDSPVIPFDVDAQYLTAQCVVYGADDDVKIEIRNADGTSVLATSADTDLAANWNTRLTASYSVPASTAPATYRVYVITASQHNTDFYVDKIMFEVREDTTAVSTYVDGSNGLHYKWMGTANASTSIKRSGMTIIRGLTIKNESSTANEIVYVAFDITATATTGIPVLAGATFENTWPLGFTTDVSIIAANGTPTVSGVIWGV